MADLKTIFHKTTTQKLGRNSLHSISPSSLIYSPYDRLRDSNKSYRQTYTDNPAKHMHEPQLGSLLSSDPYAKNIITHNSMQEQISWFYSNFRVEALINLVSILMMLFGLYHFGWVQFSFAITVFIYSFFTVGIKHHFFATGILRIWAQISQYASIFVLMHLLFVRFMLILDSNFTRSSTISINILPVLQVTCIYCCLIRKGNYFLSQTHTCHPLLVTKNMLLNLGVMLKNIYLIKWAVIIVYFGIFTIEIGILQYFGTFYVYLPEIIGFTILLSQILAIIIFIAINYWIVSIIGTIISNWFLGSSYTIASMKLPLDYSQRKINTVPMILQLMKIQEPENAKQQEIDIIHERGLAWILTMLDWSPDSLNTKIETSKFYSSYWSIFGEYVSKHLRRTMFRLLGVEKALQSRNQLQRQKKPIINDAVHPLRIQIAQLKLWISICEFWTMNRLTDLILMVLNEANYPQTYSLMNLQSLLEDILRKYKQIKDGTKDSWPDEVLRSKVQKECIRVKAAKVKIESGRYQ